MKKILLFLLVVTMSFVVLAQQNAFANEDDGLIEIYPYDDLGALEGTNPGPGHQAIGDSHWNIVYNGYRYNVARGGVRVAALDNDAEGFFDDDNTNGFIEGSEIPAISWNAFGSLYINDTDTEFILDPISDEANASRSDFSAVLHRMYAYWDENGVLQMFEDHITARLVVNDNYDAEATLPHDPLTADYRFPTEAEKTAYAASEAPEVDFPEMRSVPIRLIRDDVDSDGYVIEPLQTYGWKNRDLAASVDEADWSVLLDYNPNNVVIPAGWTVFSFGTLDRSSWPIPMAWLETLPLSIAENDDEAMVLEYETQAPSFGTTLSAELDDDPSVAGVQKLVGKNETFELPTTITASWVNMFDENDKVQNVTEILDYTVDFYEEGQLLDTVTFTWDGSAYTADKTIAQYIDSTDINNRYELVYHVVSPDTQETTINVQVAVGYYPPKFSGVAPRFVDEDVMVDLLGVVTAENGYGLDMTNEIEISYPASLNPYYPQPGTYQIDLEVTYNHHEDAVPHMITLNGIEYTFDKADMNSPVISTYPYSVTQPMIVYTDTAALRTALASGTGYGSVITVIAADGTVKEAYDRYNWKYIDPTDGLVYTGDSATFAAWGAAVEIEEGGFALAAHGSVYSPPLRVDTTAGVHFGDLAALELGVDEVNDYVTTTTSYVLTVDDRTAPVALVVNDNYSVVSDQFANEDDAILANVVAMDNFDAPEDIIMYVEDDGGLDFDTPDTYDVVVGIEDAMGNYTSVSFSVEVVAAKVSAAELEAQVADLEATIAALETALEAADAADKTQLLASIATLQGLVDDLQDTIDALQADLDTLQTDFDASQETGCGSTITLGSSLAVVSILTLVGIAAIFLRKRY